MRRDVERAIDDAQRASQSGIRELLARQEVRVLMRLVSAYRAGSLTPQDAMVGIGVISELRSLEGDVKRTIKRGTDAAADLTSFGE